MSTIRHERIDRQHIFRRSSHMQQFEQRFAEVQERQLRFRSERAEERHVEGRRRSIRFRIGQSLVRLGSRLSGDAMTAPAWQG
ncbi:MAG: hypothetical protein WCK58_15890 [Chloroflexota bacterium]